MTDHDDAEPDERLRALRSVWLSMPDEEPPQRGLAELMAAARTKAEDMSKPSVGAWQKLVALLRRPPVLALASIMVLLGGAVFVMQRRDKLEYVPTAQQPRKHEAQGAAPVHEATEESPMLAAPEPEPAEITKTEISKIDPAPARRPRSRPTPTVTPPTDVKRHDPLPGIPKEKLDVGAGKDSAFDSSTADEGRTANETKAAEANVEVPKGSSVAGATASLEPDAAARPSPSPPVSQLHAQARAAAVRGDCTAVRTTSQRIAKLDAGYYRANVAGDKALAKCLVTAAQ